MSNGNIYLVALATVGSRVWLGGTALILWTIVGYGDLLSKPDQDSLAQSAVWAVAVSVFAIAWLTAKSKIIPAAPDKEAR